MKPTSTTLMLALLAGLLLSALVLVDVLHEDQGSTFPDSSKAVTTPPAPSELATTPTSRAQRSPLASQKREHATYDELFARLVALGGEQRRRLAASELAAAQAVNERIRVLLGELFEVASDADGRAFSTFCTAACPPRTPDEEVTALACELLVSSGLARRHELVKRGGERAELDAFVGMILTAIAGDEARAPAMHAWLLDQPFLGAAHEAPVMELVRRAATEGWLAQIASGLLRTLWKNLEASGQRRPEEIAALALLAKDGENPSARLAALKTLLLAADGRFRALVEQEVLHKRDREVARELAAAAALDLPVREALDLLVRLSPLAPGGMIGPFMTLGHRDPKLLVDSYERLLADDVAPQLRADLVTGAGFEGRGGSEIARTAFELDRDPGVRERAIFVLTAKGGPEVGEKVLMAALDDRTFSGDPVRLAGLVLALENLIPGDPNVVDRVSRRILARSELSEADRRKVEELKGRALPSGSK